MLVTLRNNFHRTEARVRIPPNGRPLALRTVRRVRRKLCCADCRCPDSDLGTRGPQTVKLVPVCTWAGVSYRIESPTGDGAR